MKKSELKKLIREVIKEQRSKDKFAPIEGTPIPIQQYPNVDAVQRTITGMDSFQFIKWYNQTFGPWLSVTRGPSAEQMLSMIGLNEKKKMSLLDILKLAKAIYDFISELHDDCCANESWCCMN